MPKAVYHSSCRDEHNRPQCDSNLDPLTLVLIVLIRCANHSATATEKEKARDLLHVGSPSTFQPWLHPCQSVYVACFLPLPFSSFCLSQWQQRRSLESTVGSGGIASVTSVSSPQLGWIAWSLIVFDALVGRIAYTRYGSSFLDAAYSN